MQRETGLTEELELLMSRRHGDRRDEKEVGIVLGTNDLQARADLMDNRISNALKESEARMTEAIKESRAQIIAFIEGHVDPKIAAIGEGHQLTQEMLRETNKKIDDLTEKVDFHDFELRIMNRS